jgi:chemotaxis protein MotB
MRNLKIWCILILGVSVTSCVSKKKLTEMETQYNEAQASLDRCQEQEMVYKSRIDASEKETKSIQANLTSTKTTLNLREEQIADLKSQIADLKNQRDRQLDQVGDLTVLSKSATDNINKTLEQIEKKDEYIKALQSAKSKADSLNLALAVNLKSVLADGIADQDIEVSVDKTVVFVNLSNKMLYRSGSAVITPRANEILGKIAKILAAHPELEVMVEGHTDNVSISTADMKDNWDLSVKRATSVVRVLQNKFNVDPSKMIAAGRGEHMPLTSNETRDGREINRRTRIIILPKIDQFYDLLNPDKVAAK